MDIYKYLRVSIDAALKAGDIVMHYYNHNNLQVTQKTDKSPLTKADIESSDLICEMLDKTGLPVLTEERPIPDHEERKNWLQYWLVDPLDGTKEFIKGIGEFTINIALIKENKPFLGVILVPQVNQIFYGSPETGVFKYENESLPSKTSENVMENAVPLHLSVFSDRINVAVSRSHPDGFTQSYINRIKEKYANLELIQAGSSLKFCLMAEGKINLYPRFSPTMEWDTAAGQAIIESMGYLMTEPDGNDFRYNKSTMLNGGFIAYHPSISLA